ncbi:hypothetical protein PGT21_036271 [Puccinia graminis f. sp. tritici]|uniref:DUF6589 domain-containing protein n=1 Tax=Puccinia graminis f. sp. tritici TaxID=56615 RepID=A0A5B0PDV3_PUCGR|nr:hypothetical protein PGT21_036271 [Puccinia graminis f. sp. tritici]
MSETPLSTPRASRLPMKDKLDGIFEILLKFNLTPKSFMIAFLEDDEESSAVRRRYYGTARGWDSTLELLLAIKKTTASHTEGKGLWEEFILAQATEIVSSQKPRSGIAPDGAYYNSSKLSQSFFSTEERQLRNNSTIERMPFLYRLLCSKLQGNKDYNVSRGERTADPEVDPAENGSDDEDVGDALDDLDNLDGSAFKRHRDPDVRRTDRVETLGNSLIFLAAGVTERVSGYLNYIGLASSRRTAHAALNSLGQESADGLTERFKRDQSSALMPILCYDNLDFQEKVHMKSVERTSTMFHGTWGYIHSPPAALLENLDAAQMSTEVLNTALHAGTKLTIKPEMFTPSRAGTEHWDSMLKSQITRVILRYLAKPVDGHVGLHKDPPPVNPITPADPRIHVLKLMVASDNSAAGVGDVLTGVIQQSGLTPEEFHSRVQIIKGDLGSCNILDSLRRQRVPAVGHQDNLDNTLAIPGAAHTLWNIAQAIFLAHWGNEKHSRDTGAWRTLHSLGIPSDKPITKKDFNLMLCHVQKVHEATLLYLVLLVVNRTNAALSDDLLQLSSETIAAWVDSTHDRFCSREAFQSDLARSSPAHMNLLLRIRDFATILEAQSSMRDGDYGRLIYMWERWSVMTQGLGKMPHYSRHLPKLLVQLKYVLPDALAQLVKNTMLLSPTGSSGHFMATDQYLEVLNYWLKYFFNHSGIGTNIDRLKDVFSPNIIVLKSLLDLLKLESGARVIHQSHHNQISWDSLNNFRRMANREQIDSDHTALESG